MSGWLLQTTVGPVTAPGLDSDDPTVTASVLAAELPQALLAVTDTVPPLVPTVVMMVAVVDVPVQLPGSVQV